jgi:ABC-type uncharacterized transport system involved in gliding motility auxiliary subunit
MNESLVGNIGVIVFIGGFVFFAIKYVRHYKQLQKAYAESGLEWPTLTREQMLEEGSIKGLYKSFAYTFKMWGIILFSRPKDTRIRTPLRKVRLTLLLFALFPFLLGFILLIGFSFIANA